MFGTDNSPPWVVVEFNAWLNQRLGPPWWPLLDGIYGQSKHQLFSKYDKRSRALQLLFSEFWWRSVTANWEQFVVSVFVWITVIIITRLVFFFWNPLTKFLTDLATKSGTKTAVDLGTGSVTLITGLVGAAFAISSNQRFVRGEAW